MNIGIVGSRTFNNYELLKETLDKYDNINNIVSGGAIGANKLGEKYAKEHNIPTIIYHPEWEKYGKKAGFIRNTYIVFDSDIIIAFWDNKSKGTLDTINKCKKMNKNLEIILF